MPKFFGLWKKETKAEEIPITVPLKDSDPALLKQKKLIGHLIRITNNTPIILNLIDYKIGDIISEISEPVSAIDQYFSTSMKTSVLLKYTIKEARFTVETTCELKTGYEEEFGEEDEPYKRVFARLILNNYNTLSIYSMIGRMIETSDGFVFRMTNADYLEEPPTTPRDEWIRQEIALRKTKIEKTPTPPT